MIKYNHLISNMRLQLDTMKTLLVENFNEQYLYELTEGVYQNAYNMRRIAKAEAKKAAEKKQKKMFVEEKKRKKSDKKKVT